MPVQLLKVNTPLFLSIFIGFGMMDWAEACKENTNKIIRRR
jgi:hypothetical protein